MARRLRALGADAFSLPGSSLRAAGNPESARRALREALAADVVVFTSPAAVRFAAKLSSLHTRAQVFAPGAGTALALKRAGIAGVSVPARADSEGLLAMPELQRLRDQRVGLVGAAGGRDLLRHGLLARGARVHDAFVYQRAPARLDRRHFDALVRNRSPLFVPLSSAAALRHLLDGLPPRARTRLLAGIAVASSARLQRAARQAGFARILRAASALDADLIAAIAAARAR